MLRIIKKIKYPLTIIIIVLIVLSTIYIHRSLIQEKYQNIEDRPILELSLEEKEEAKNNDNCTVDIKGAIKNPGVYQVSCNNNVNDVINIAGGLLKNSDTSIINLAKQITDEMVIIIYTKEEVKNSNIVDTVIKTVEKECICPNIQNDGCINNEITDDITNQNTLININTASLDELLTLPGIGESKARAIIRYRETNGDFITIEDIKNVEGIGSKLYEEIKIYITT